VTSEDHLHLLPVFGRMVNQRLKQVEAGLGEISAYPAGPAAVRGANVEKMVQRKAKLAEMAKSFPIRIGQARHGLNCIWLVGITAQILVGPFRYSYGVVTPRLFRGKVWSPYINLANLRSKPHAQSSFKLKCAP
jgi:hypothetical protein